MIVLFIVIDYFSLAWLSDAAMSLKLWTDIKNMITYYVKLKLVPSLREVLFRGGISLNCCRLCVTACETNKSKMHEYVQKYFSP